MRELGRRPMETARSRTCAAPPPSLAARPPAPMRASSSSSAAGEQSGPSSAPASATRPRERPSAPASDSSRRWRSRGLRTRLCQSPGRSRRPSRGRSPRAAKAPVFLRLFSRRAAGCPRRRGSCSSGRPRPRSTFDERGGAERDRVLRPGAAHRERLARHAVDRRARLLTRARAPPRRSRGTSGGPVGPRAALLDPDREPEPAAARLRLSQSVPGRPQSVPGRPRVLLSVMSSSVSRR